MRRDGHDIRGVKCGHDQTTEEGENRDVRGERRESSERGRRCERGEKVEERAEVVFSMKVKTLKSSTPVYALSSSAVQCNVCYRLYL